MDDGRSRPRILYVDRASSDDDARCRLEIRAGLRQDYDVDDVIGLTPGVLQRVRLAEAERPYEAIVTHIPPGEDRGTAGWPEPYRDSLDIVAGIRRCTDALVIAFTSACGRDLAAIGWYVDRIVQKTTIAQDLDSLREALEWNGRRRRMPATVPSPRLLVAPDAVVVEAEVRLRVGITPPAAGQIVRECQAFPGEVTLSVVGREADDAVTARSILDVVMLAAAEGDRVLISVSGTGSAAQTLARRLYGIVTSRNGLDLQPERFLDP